MSEREWHFYLDDMIGFAEKVLTSLSTRNAICVFFLGQLNAAMNDDLRPVSR